MFNQLADFLANSMGLVQIKSMLLIAYNTPDAEGKKLSTFLNSENAVAIKEEILTHVDTFSTKIEA